MVVRLHSRFTSLSSLLLLINDGTVTDLLPFPTDLALILLDPDIGVYTLAADQLKVAVAPISLLVLQRVHNCKVILGTPASSRSQADVHSMLRLMLHHDTP